MSILFIGIFQSSAIFNCQSSRMEMKLSFRHKCISRRISDIVFMSHNIARIYIYLQKQRREVIDLKVP